MGLPISVQPWRVLENYETLEGVLNTAHSGFVAYDLPGTANARILWGTGRGSYLRTGSIRGANLEAAAYLPLCSSH